MSPFSVVAFVVVSCISFDSLTHNLRGVPICSRVLKKTKAMGANRAHTDVQCYKTVSFGEKCYLPGENPSTPDCSEHLLIVVIWWCFGVLGMVKENNSETMYVYLDVYVHTSMDVVVFDARRSDPIRKGKENQVDHFQEVVRT